MPKYNSPLGNKQFDGQSLPEYDVPDETEQYDQPVMRSHGPSMHGSQPQVDIATAIAYQNRLQEAQEPAFDNSLEIEREIRQAKEAKRTGRERLNDGARRRVEMLVGMTLSTREVNLEGNVFVLLALRSKEMRAAIMAAAEFDGTVQSPFEIRRQLLARSLSTVAGVEVAQFVGSNTLDAKLQLIDDLPEALLNRLYSEYLILVQEAREKFSVKSPAEAEEVIADLKK